MAATWIAWSQIQIKDDRIFQNLTNSIYLTLADTQIVRRHLKN